MLLTISFTVQSQTAKPTKEQTMEYITNTLKDYWEIFRYQEGKTTGVQSITDISFSNCTLSVKVLMKYSSTEWNVTKEYLFDLKNIESIESYKQEDFLAIIFKSYNAKKLIKIDEVDIYNGTKKETKEFTNRAIIPGPTFDEKIFKAFNHLRKLCGAPEPIKF